MKKILCILMVFGMCIVATGCSIDDSKKNDNQEEKTETKESNLETVGKLLTFDSKDVNGTSLGIAKDGDTDKFKMYLTISDSDKELATAMNMTVGGLLYSVDGTDSELYDVDNNAVFITKSNATPDSMKNSMDAFLNEKGLTLDQVKSAMKEKFGI